MSPRPPLSLLQPRVGAWKGLAIAELAAARQRLQQLLARLSPALLVEQPSALMSPPIWDVAHVANFEEQWLLRALGGPALCGPDVDHVYDAFANPRSARASLPLLPPERAWAYAARVRESVLRHLETLPEDSDEPLLHAGFVFGMVAQHEQQHIETLLATLQLLPQQTLAPPEPTGELARGYAGPAEIRIEAGAFQMGSDAAWAYDNERPVHSVATPAFFIDAVPVSNGDFAEFIADRGYLTRSLWTEAGWRHRAQENLEHPLFWKRDGGHWLLRHYGRWEALPLEEPVQHVCWFEADAFARWKGKRLPTEAEWEKAASFRTDEGLDSAPSTYPWGEAAPSDERVNAGGARLRPCAVGSCPAGASGAGVMQLLGDVWEWTASDFVAYPGFRAFPYAEYSEVFFGPSYKVLRGGAWSVAPVALRSSFRNWDYPIRRQIFVGFRCARDV